jgi:hypothetical protein
MTVKVNLGDYESVEVSVGGSLTVENTAAAVKRAQRTLMRQHEDMLAAKAAELREMWSNK